jgi:hypothetical protein
MPSPTCLALGRVEPVLETRPTEQRLTRLNAICPYYTMFPLEFPLQALNTAQASEWVLDPFCGRGTTLFAARLLGVSAVGIDSNPVAVAATAAKLVAVSPASIVARAKTLLREGRSESVPPGRFWRLCFDPRVLRELCVLRASLTMAKSPVDLALRAIQVAGRTLVAPARPRRWSLAHDDRQRAAPRHFGPGYRELWWSRHELRSAPARPNTWLCSALWSPRGHPTDACSRIAPPSPS